MFLILAVRITCFYVTSSSNSDIILQVVNCKQGAKSNTKKKKNRMFWISCKLLLSFSKDNPEFDFGD